MAIQLRQQLRLSQQLVMTPQLQQAIKLLQLNRQELTALIEQELQENPVLEEVEIEERTDAEVSDDTPGEEGGGEASEVSTDAASETPTEVDPSELTPSSADAAEEGPSDADKIADVEWDNYMENYPQTGLDTRSAGEDSRPSIEATLTRRPSLSDHLTWQIQLSAFDDHEVAVSRWIVGNLDDDGYLQASIEELARQAGAEEELVERTLAKVQQLDPTGVASRDLRECLQLQLQALEIQDPVVLAMVDRHLDLLQKRDFRGLIRALGSTPEKVSAAANVISSLEPKPGRGFSGEDPIYITPDIYVYKGEDDFHILLNEDGLPKLKINNLYRDVLSGGKSVSKETREYVHEKLRAAQWLIKSIHQRERTMYKVMKSIINQQREFFEKGISHLKPLNLRDVADDIEMHESTVSRVTTHKYVHTPRGIFELKYFFNSSISRFEGESLASESVKERIRKIISNEDSRRPLSDQRIAEMLKSANINIARRTVTKYRESMNLLASTKRRQMG
ncbi:MAG: RNA polymerase factor sigma-54 [Myxococcota bacterium]